MRSFKEEVYDLVWTIVAYRNSGADLDELIHSDWMNTCVEKHSKRCNMDPILFREKVLSLI